MDDACISRAAALDCLTGYVPETVEEFAARTIRRIKNLPAADVKPVVRGRWIREDSGMVYCSACGEYPEYSCQCYSKFCLNCGADMREG